MCIPSFKILAIIVPEKTVTQKNLTELRSYLITELRTDQIQYSPTFSKWGYKDGNSPREKTFQREKTKKKKKKKKTPRKKTPF